MSENPMTDAEAINISPDGYAVVPFALAARMERALALIALYGGKTTDEGVSCNGSWCAEQARATIRLLSAKSSAAPQS